MCWSLEVSVGSYAIVCVLAAALVRRNYQNDRWFALWLCWVGQVQLAEAFLWLDQACTGMNQAASKALLGIIALEPLVAALLALACTPRARRARWQWALAAAAAAGAVYAMTSIGGEAGWCSRPCSACGSDHLAWPWVDDAVPAAYRLLFLASICAPFAAMRPLAHGAAGAGYTAAIFAIAFVAFRRETSFESMWCWLSVGGFSCPLLLSKPSAAAGKARAPVPHPGAVSGGASQILLQGMSRYLAYLLSLTAPPRAS